MPQPDPRQCARCANWQAQDRQRQYSAWCAACERKTLFDDSCRAWQPAPVVWPNVPPSLTAAAQELFRQKRDGD